MGELLAAQRVHSLLHVGQDAVPFLAHGRPIATLRVIHNAAAAADGPALHAEAAREGEDGAAELLNLVSVLCLDRDDSLRDNGAEQQRN